MGWTLNTVDPDAPTDGPKISAVAIVMTTLAMVAVILRVYVRQFMVKAFGSGMSRLIISFFSQVTDANNDCRRLGHCICLGEFTMTLLQLQLR